MSRATAGLKGADKLDAVGNTRAHRTGHRNVLRQRRVAEAQLYRLEPAFEQQFGKDLIEQIKQSDVWVDSHNDATRTGTAP